MEPEHYWAVCDQYGCVLMDDFGRALVFNTRTEARTAIADVNVDGEYHVAKVRIHSVRT